MDQRVTSHFFMEDVSPAAARPRCGAKAAPMWLAKVRAPGAGAGSPLAARSHLSVPFVPPRSPALPCQRRRGAASPGCRSLRVPRAPPRPVPRAPCPRPREPWPCETQPRAPPGQDEGVPAPRPVWSHGGQHLFLHPGVWALCAAVGFFLLYESWGRTGHSSPSRGRAADPSEPAPVFQSLEKSLVSPVLAAEYSSEGRINVFIPQAWSSLPEGEGLFIPSSCQPRLRY